MTLDIFRQSLVFILGELRPLDKNISPEEFDFVVNSAQLKYYKTKLGLPEQYQPGVPLPQQVFSENQLSESALRKFKVLIGYDDTTPLTVDAKGSATLPSDFYYLIEMTHTDTNRIRFVELVTDQEFAQRISSKIKQPSRMFPIASMMASSMRVYPKDIQYMNMIYLRLPKDIHFAYKEEDGFITYDSINSVQFEWNEVEQVDILSITLETMGINLKRGELFQYAEKMNKEGI